MILLCLLFLFSCEKKGKNLETEFSSKFRYLAEVKIGEFETKGEVFFDKEENLHFLHNDPTTLLFGMEEVFCEKKIKTYYKDLEYERDFVNTGTAIIKMLFDTIDLNDAKLNSSKNIFTKKYVGKDFSFDLTIQRDDNKKYEIKGNGWDTSFQIIFTHKA